MSSKIIYEEIAIANKRDYYEKNNPFMEDRFDEKVCCLHCDNEFVFNEFKAVREKSTGDEYIVCKYFPECNGSIIDFMPADYKTE
jgi:hypothetical protein